MMTTSPGAGIGLKPEHFEAARQCAAPGLWFEVHPENYFVPGGPRLAWLAAIRATHPVALHGVALSLAADVPPDRDHLRRLAALIRWIEPARVTEHLAWSSWRGVYYPDLLPIARTRAALERIAENIDIAQTMLGRQISIENPSHYLRIEDHDWSETDFLAALVHRTGCSLLLDVNNIYVSARNLGCSAEAWLDAFPGEAVSEIHLAGHTRDANPAVDLLIDSHDTPVATEVWTLYERLVTRIGPRPTLIERDGKLPAFEDLMAERDRAQDVLQCAATQAAGSLAEAA